MGDDKIKFSLFITLFQKFDPKLPSVSESILKQSFWKITLSFRTKFLGWRLDSSIFFGNGNHKCWPHFWIFFIPYVIVHMDLDTFLKLVPNVCPTVLGRHAKQCYNFNCMALLVSFLESTARWYPFLHCKHWSKCSGCSCCNNLLVHFRAWENRRRCEFLFTFHLLLTALKLLCTVLDFVMKSKFRRFTVSSDNKLDFLSALTDNG